MKRKKITLIKLGGSVITDKTKANVVMLEIIKRLAGEVAALRKKYKGSIILGHGAGSFAHVPAKKYRTKEGIINSESLYGMCVTENSARQLNQIVINNFLEAQVPVFPFSPGSFILSESKKATNSYISPIMKALEINLIPVVYGDVIIDTNQGCTIFSTEDVLALLAKKLKNTYKIEIIYLTDVDGVYNAEGSVIPEINPNNYQTIKKALSGSTATDVTGGMLHKVGMAVDFAKKTGIKTRIVNGNKEGLLKKIILNNFKTGTLITN